MNPRRLLFLLPLLAACAQTATTTDVAADATVKPDDAPDRVVWVRMPGRVANASVVLTGTRVQVVAGARQMRGDTLYAKVPFAIALPDSTFELQIATRGAAPGDTPLAQVEYTTVNAMGEKLQVNGEGTKIILSREAPGRQLQLGGSAAAMFSMRARAGE